MGEMGELFDLAQERRNRRSRHPIERPSDSKPFDYMQDRPPLLASTADVSKIPTEELARLVQTDNLAYMLMGVEYMVDANRWTDEEIADYAKTIKDLLNSLSDEEREAVFNRVQVIKEYEAEYLGTN
jgi:hypothetical protein